MKKKVLFLLSSCFTSLKLPTSTHSSWLHCFQQCLQIMTFRSSETPNHMIMTHEGNSYPASNGAQTSTLFLMVWTDDQLITLCFCLITAIKIAAHLKNVKENIAALAIEWWLSVWRLNVCKIVKFLIVECTYKQYLDILLAFSAAYQQLMVRPQPLCIELSQEHHLWKRTGSHWAALWHDLQNYIFK